MSDSDTREEERTAAQIASDPAFAALQASGAPLIAAIGDPLHVVYANPSALAVFGDDFEALSALLFGRAEPSSRRLLEIIDSVRHSFAPRLERLQLSLDSVAQTVTIVCRRVFKDPGPSYFVIAALGVRPATHEGVPHSHLGQNLRAPRFLWRTDASGRVIEVSHVLGDIVGMENADLLGREFAPALRELGLDNDGRLERSLARQKSWSGLEVQWPLGTEGGGVPTTLGAFPIFDDARRFAGFQGYGVLHLDRLATQAVSDSAAPPPMAAPLDGENAAGDDYPAVEFSGANVVPLRPLSNQTRNAASMYSDNSHNLVSLLSSGDERPAEAALTPNEQSAFEEIARALSAVAEMRPTKGSVRDLMQVVLRASRGDDGASQQDKGEAAPGRALALLEQLPVGVLVARGADALYANRALLDYLGYSDIEALDRDGGLARIFFGRAPKDFAQRATSGAIEVLAHDGEIIDVDPCVQTIDWDGGLATLITLRRARAKNAPAMPGEEAAQLQAVLDATSDAVAILDSDGGVRSVNRAFANLFGAGATSAFATQSFLSFIGEDDRRLVSDRLADVSRHTEGLRLDAKTCSGAVFPAELTFRRIGAPSNGRICVALRDLTHVRRSNREIETARLEAERASAAKSDFLAKVSHEIRTPLNAIIGFAEVMMEERFGPIGNDRYKDYLKDVHVSGTHVLSLVNDLLDLSKIEAGKFELELERVDANAIVSECVSIMQTQASRARVIMRLSLSPRLPHICADGRSLKQILLNLLSNAVKFNEPGGQVIVSSALTDAGYVMLRVKDTGVGMSDEELQTALEPFRQIGAPRSVKGTGLGLPVTKALIEANQASFTIKSRKNEGTLVEIAFPPLQVLAAE
jgi:PAS domain S-box-containing protein